MRLALLRKVQTFMNVTTNRLALGLFTFVLAASAYVPTHSWAQEAGMFEILECRPNQDQATNDITIERVSPTMVKAHGSVMAPSPGYKAMLRPDNNGGLVLEFTPPPAGQMNAQVLSAIKLDQTMSVPPLALPIGIEVDKSFNWGPDAFVCEPVDRPDYDSPQLMPRLNY